MAKNSQRTYRKRINVNVVQPKSKEPQIANIISIIALIVSMVLAYYTKKVFDISNSQIESIKKSADASVKSAEAAENTLTETKRYNKEYIDLQKQLFYSNNDDSRNRSKRDSLSLDAQIQSVKQNQKQFELLNRPFIQLGNFSFKRQGITNEYSSHGVI